MSKKITWVKVTLRDAAFSPRVFNNAVDVMVADDSAYIVVVCDDGRAIFLRDFVASVEVKETSDE